MATIWAMFKEYYIVVLVIKYQRMKSVFLTLTNMCSQVILLF